MSTALIRIVRQTSCSCLTESKTTWTEAVFARWTARDLEYGRLLYRLYSKSGLHDYIPSFASLDGTLLHHVLAQGCSDHWS